MIKMNDFEQGLANIMGSFIETELDCVEKQNQEIEQLKQENKQLKDIRETAINYIDQVIMYKSCAREIDKELDILIGILRGGNNE